MQPGARSSCEIGIDAWYWWYQNISQLCLLLFFTLWISDIILVISLSGR